jgi:hypothetical protein
MTVKTQISPAPTLEQLRKLYPSLFQVPDVSRSIQSYEANRQVIQSKSVIKDKRQCHGLTKNDEQCNRMVSDDNNFCYQHLSQACTYQPTAKTGETQCRGMTQSGHRCKNKISGGDYCHLHDAAAISGPGRSPSVLEKTVYDQPTKESNLGQHDGGNDRTFPSPSFGGGQCQATTKKGTQCKRTASNGGYCYQHG